MAIKDFYCVMDKQYAATKKEDIPPRFISIKVEQAEKKPSNTIKRCDHADITYSWFDNPTDAKKFKLELTQEV